MLGMYIATSMALDATVESEVLWKDGQHEEAAALEAVRALVFNKGKSVIGSDDRIIHGTISNFYVSE
jgi:hypothetical protein